MIPCSFASTSSNVQESLSLFWLISRADVATPPALLALLGQNRMPFSCRYCVLYDKAFNQFAFGEASAIGMISAVTIVILTVILNRTLKLNSTEQEG